MKKKYLKKFLVLTLILTLCTTTMLSGTLAAYTSEESGTATVTAAQFKLDSTKLTDTQEITLTETHTGYGTDATLFPGQSGYFTVDASFISDVDTTITTTVLTSIYGDADITETVAVDTDTYADILDVTGLRFYIISEDNIVSNSDAADVAGITTTYIAETAPTYGDEYIYSGLAEGLASTLFVENADADNDDETDGITEYEYDASAEGSALIGGTVYYVYWIWEYEMTTTYADIDAAGVSIGTETLDDGDTLYTEDSGEITGGSGGTTYYSYAGKYYASQTEAEDAAIDAAEAAYTDGFNANDTAWGNAIADYVATATSDFVDIIIDISISATQEPTAFPD